MKGDFKAKNVGTVWIQEKEIFWTEYMYVTLKFGENCILNDSQTHSGKLGIFVIKGQGIPTRRREK